MSRKSSFFRFIKSHCTMKILILITFTLTAISSTQSSNSSEAHDITTLLNNTIAKTFHNMNSVTINKLVLSIENLKSFTFATYADCELGPFENEFYFTGITVTPLKVESAHLRHEFYHNRMTIFFNYLSIEMKGYLGATPDTVHVGFERSLDFKNISIYVIAEPMEGFSKNEFYPYIDFIHYDGYESNYVYSPWFHENLTTDFQYELEIQIKSFLPSLFEFNLRNNENFVQTLHATFCHHLEEEITSLSPLDIFKMKNYFFIPNVTSLDRTLSNIAIKGMHNFHSHSFAENAGLTVSTLTIKDIRGTADLDYGDETIFPLHFEVDHISITVDRTQQSINVTPYNYTVIDTTLNASLTEYQSKWVMEGIQLAIASSIMPSMKYYRNRTQSTNSLEEHPIVKMITKLSQQFESSTIQKLYDTWNVTIPLSLKAELSVQIESHTYNISIDAKPEEALKLYPDWIKCNFYNYLQIQFQTSPLLGKISLLNTTHEVNEIDFEMGHASIGVFKRNNSDDFDVETYLTSDVQLLSNSYNFTRYERLEIEQEAQNWMISLIEKTVSSFAEPLLSSPLDYCTAPVKIFDDFLPFYADHELPFRVPEGRIAKDFMTPKINNVIITEWEESPSAFVSIDQHLFNGSMVVSTTYVDLHLDEAKTRINLNNRWIPFDELQLTERALQIRNYTDIADIVVQFNFSPEADVYSQDNKTVSLTGEQMEWIEIKLQRILDDCFNNLTSLVF
ncbi:uncharacterized protein LOC135837320 isoform X2 [Planococcus citri]|uniref:uncharacterized protein LOC135837320 isoform X2 n=1 Tax=Planococcus citri TaxID=170843 RepID=UPI0031F773C1